MKEYIELTKRPKQNTNFASLVSRIAPDAIAEIFQQGSEPSATGGGEALATAGRWDVVELWIKLLFQIKNPKIQIKTNITHVQNLTGKIYIFVETI